MNTAFEVILRTGKLHWHDAADLALTEAGIPHYSQQESVSGVIEAMGIDPSPAPGVWWSILVPADTAEKAKRVVQSLPYDYSLDPEIWDCSPSKRGRRLIVIYS